MRLLTSSLMQIIEGVMMDGFIHALVAVSIVIAVLAAYAALDLSGLVTAACGMARLGHSEHSGMP
jgi:NO-binding membrane sensor protein with MHYT domain